MSTSAFSFATNEYGNQNKDLLLLQCRQSLGKSTLIRIRPVANNVLGFDANGDPATYTASDLITVEGALPLSGGTMTGAILFPSRTIAASTGTLAASDFDLIINNAGTCTLTLGTATNGRSVWVRTITANTVVSAGSNVVPLAGGSAGTAILAATAGKWARLVGDGTNWQIQASN